MTNSKNKNKSRIDRLPSDKNNQLKEYLSNLIDDAANYDKGNSLSIKRSSVILRSLYYDTGQSHSLIKQIGDKDHIILDSYSNPTEKDIAYYGNIYTASFTDSQPGKYKYMFLFHPTKEIPIKKIKFEDWWDGNVIVIGKNKITRKQVVTVVANQDGGAHFDSKIDKQYEALKNGYLGWVYGETDTNTSMLLFGTPDTSAKTIEHIELAILRQIVHETIVSLSRWYKIPVNYTPDFDYLWQLKLNNIGFHFTIQDKR